MKYKNLYILFTLFLFITCSQRNKSSSGEVGNVREKLPSIIEVVSKTDTISSEKFLAICKKYNIDSTSVYQWRNHLIVYGVLADDQLLMHDLTMAYADEMLEVRNYDAPYYVFDRKDCEDKDVASEWSHTIMTANLVADTTMQREYMNYHATQSEDWPEIATGFCNADFQQLLMFRNNRRLMLIISIPKGKTLDELNPKTTENNPRVDEWNAIMSKYQEDIDGAGDAVWVTFSPLF
jgi:hypothetical protein